MNRFIVFLFVVFFVFFLFRCSFLFPPLQNSWRCWRTKIKRTKCWRVKIFNYRYVWRRFKLFPSSPVDCCVPVCVCAWVWVRALFVFFFLCLFVRSEIASIFTSIFFSHFILFLFDSLFSCNFVRSFTRFFIHVCYRWVCLFVYSIFMFQRFPCDVKDCSFPLSHRTFDIETKLNARDNEWYSHNVWIMYWWW